jgi:glucoside 3-dehydrogenase (cytochrome c) hitch-hiker subunit
MNKHDFDNGRREALQVMLGLGGLAALNPPRLQAWLQHIHEVASPQAGGSGQAAGRSFRPLLDPGTPKFFSEAEMRTLSALVERIIPTTDTPGASAAGVHWYLDTVIETEPELQREFRDGLAWLNSASGGRFQQPFGDCTQEQQAQVVESMLPKSAPGNDFFETVKLMTIVAYYSSEIGLTQELGWPESVVKRDFIGCPHGGHSLDYAGAKMTGTDVGG